MSVNVYVVGVGMTNFEKPNAGIDYPEIGKAAVEQALKDCNISYDSVQQAVCGYVYGDSTSGQRVLYQVGMTGIPIINVNNHGATGATALFLAHQLIQGGLADVVLALGFEKMTPGRLPGTAYPDRTYPLDKHQYKMLEMVQVENAPPTAQCFGNAAIEHMKKYGTSTLQFAEIAVKNHHNGSKNPRALNKRSYTLDEVLNSKYIFGPLTKLQCCSNSSGAAAAVLMSEKAVANYRLHEKAVQILGMAMATDTAAVFIDKSVMKIAGYDMTALAAKQVYEKTGISPSQIDVVELHDCFSTNELITYEGLQLCGEGKGGEFVDAGDNTYGGKVVVNPSGGLLARGNPIGATGLAQCAELVWQLRGEAENRQVPNATIGLQHNLGLGGAVVVAIYRGFSSNVSRGPKGTVAPDKFRVHKYLKSIEKSMQNKGMDPVTVPAVFAIKVSDETTGAEGYWVVNTKEGSMKITYMAYGEPDFTVTGTDGDIVEVMIDETDSSAANYQGTLRLQGQLDLSLRHKSLANKVRAKI